MSQFRVEPEACLNDALARGLKSVFIVGLAKNGIPLVWCSDDTDSGLALVERGIERINSPQFTREVA